MNFLLLFDHLSSSSALVPLGIGLLHWKYIGENLRLVVGVALASVVSDSLSLILFQYHINTWPINNVFFFTQFTLLFLVLGYHRDIKPLRILFYVCLAFALLNYGFIQTPKTLNSYTFYAGGILMIISALNFLYHLLTKMPVERVQSLPLFWVAFGILIYFGGTLFLFLFNNYLMAYQIQDHQLIWILHNFLNITKNAFLFMALWINYRGKTSPS